MHRSAPGTIITATRSMDSVLVTSIVLKNNVTLVDIISTRMMGQFGFLATVFEMFRKNKISVDVVATSEVGAGKGTDVVNSQRLRSFCGWFFLSCMFERLYV